MDTPQPALSERIWQSLSLELPENQSDLVSLICWETDALGSEERFHEGSLLALFYYPDSIDTAVLATRIGQICDDFGVRAGLSKAEKVEAPADLWMAGFRDYFRGIEVGEFFVRPPWIPLRGSGIDIQIDPSYAFGTGTHESTQLILEQLPRLVDQMKSLLDIGTGSGILSWAAQRVSPHLRIVAMDNDPDAIAVAARNGLLNQLRVPLVIGSPESIRGSFDLVFANLTRPLLRRLAPELGRLASQRLVTSGFTTDESHLVEESILAPGGWKVGGRSEKQGWGSLHFERLR